MIGGAHAVTKMPRNASFNMPERSYCRNTLAPYTFLVRTTPRQRFPAWFRRHASVAGADALATAGIVPPVG